MSDGFFEACLTSDLENQPMHLCEVDDTLVIVFCHEGNYYCIDDVCTHDGGTLSDGEVEGCQIVCPRHGARFDIRNGAAVTMPATEDTTAHEVKVEDGKVWVRLAGV